MSGWLAQDRSDFCSSSLEGWFANLLTGWLVAGCFGRFFFGALCFFRPWALLAFLFSASPAFGVGLPDGWLAGWLTAALAAFVSHGVAFIFAYFGQKKVAFRSTSKHNVSFPRYALLQFVCATAAAAAAATAESLGFIEPFMVALLTTTILGLTTYIASSKWVFRE